MLKSNTENNCLSDIENKKLIAQNLFVGEQIVQLNTKDPDYDSDLGNSYKNLEDHFLKLVDDWILKEYNYEGLCKDKTNIVKLSVFVNMLNLYHLYINLIPKSFAQDLVCSTEVLADKISSGKAAYLFKNSRKSFFKKNNDNEKYYVLDLEKFADKVKKAFKPGEATLQALEAEKKKQIKEKLKEKLKSVNIFTKESEQPDKTEEKLAKDYEKFRFANDFCNGAPDGNNSESVIKTLTKNKKDAIKNINVFKKFISKMMDYNFGDKDKKVDSKSEGKELEKKLRVKLDFILLVVDDLCDSKILPEITNWLIKCYATISNESHEYDVQFALVEDQIKSLLKKSKKNQNFGIPSGIILRNILGSKFYENYTLSNLEDIFKIVSDKKNDTDFRIQFINKIIQNENKKICVKNASEFMEIVNFFVNHMASSQHIQTTNSKTDKKAKMSCSELTLRLSSENKKLLAKVLKKINVSTLDINDNENVLEFIMDLDNGDDNNFDIFAVFVEKFRFATLVRKGKTKIKCLVQKMINILYARYKKICDTLKNSNDKMINNDSITVFADAVKYFYGNFLYLVVENRISQNIEPDDFTRLIQIAGFLSEKNLLQKIIDSGDATKQKEVLGKNDQKLARKLKSELLKKMYTKSVINCQTKNVQEKKSLELQIEENKQRENELQNKFVKQAQNKKTDKDSDEFPMPDNNKNNAINTDDMYPGLDHYDNNIITNYNSDLSSKKTNVPDETMSKSTNKFDINQINYDLCHNNLIDFSIKFKVDFTLYGLYQWYEYFVQFVQSKTLNIKSLPWYKWFLECRHYNISKEFATEPKINIKLLADFLIHVCDIKKKTKAQLSSSTTIHSLDSLDIKNLCAYFKKYIKYCFQDNNFPNLKDNMNRLIQFAEAILSLYIEPQDDTFLVYPTNEEVRWSYIYLLTKAIDELDKSICNSQVKRNPNDYFYCRYTLSKLVLIIKKHFLQFESTKKLDYLSSQYRANKPSSDSTDQLKIDYKSAKKRETLKSLLSYFDELEKKYEYKKDSDIDKSSTEHIPTDKQAIDIKNDIDKSDKEHVQSDYEKLNSALDYDDLENKLASIKEDNQKLLVELFKSNVNNKSGFFIQGFSSLKIRQEKLYAITTDIKKSWENKNIDTFFPLAFHLIDKFYEIFRIKYEYCKLFDDDYKKVVRLFSGCVYENFWSSKNITLSKELIGNVLLDYFDQLVYADYFEKELPKLLDERKNISKILKERPKKIAYERDALAKNKDNDKEIKHQILFSKIHAFDKDSFEKAKGNLKIQTPDNVLEDNELKLIEEEQNRIFQSDATQDALLNLLCNLNQKLKKAKNDKSNSDTLNTIIQEFLEADNRQNDEFLFGENGKLLSEFKNKKSEQLNDLNIDNQLSIIAGRIIFNQKNKKEYVGWKSINSCLSEYTKADNKNKLNLNIGTLSENIASGIVFKPDDDPTDLFKSIQKIYAKNENKDQEQYRIRLDDVFEIIKVMFLDETISPKLIDILMDNSLFEPKSLSTKNLKTLAQIVKFKNKNIDKNFEIQGETLDDFMNFVSVKHLPYCLGFNEKDLKPYNKLTKCDASTFFDCVVVFYRKEINHDKQEIGKFTTKEINQILNAFYYRCDDWYALCKFIKYNWNGFDCENHNYVVRFDNNCKIWPEQFQQTAISELFNSLMHPIEVLHTKILDGQNTVDKRIYRQTLISGMKSIKAISRFCGSKIDISNVITNYASFLYDCIKEDNKDKFSFLIDDDYKPMFIHFVNLLNHQEINGKVTKYIARKTVDAILQKAQKVKFPIYKLYWLIEFVHCTEFYDLTLFNYFQIKHKDKDQSQEAKSARKAMKYVIIKHLQVLPNCYNCYLSQDDFDTFRNELLKTGLRLNVDQFIRYLQLADSLIQDNEENRFSSLEKCLEILAEPINFTHWQLMGIAMCCFFPKTLTYKYIRDNQDNQKELKNNVGNINNLDLKRDLVPMFSRLRRTSKKDFGIICSVNINGKDGNLIRLSIAKSIANASVKKFNSDIERINDVLKQFNEPNMKIETKDLDEIFRYYNLENETLAIYENGNSVNQNNLNLLVSCVQVLSSDQFRLQNEISNNKNKDEKEKNKGENNIDSCFNSPAMKFLEANFTHSEYGTLQMGYDAIIELIDAVLSSQDKSSSDQQKQDLVLNLLCLFWTPVHDNKMLSINSLKNKISTTINDNKEESWLNDSAFTKKVAVMYFVKHLYSLLLTIGQEEIYLKYYQNISTAIQTLQQQLSDYNNEPENKNRKISKDDISNLYKDMIGEVESENKNNKNNGNKKNNESKSHLPKVNLQAKLFEYIKGGILDLITSDDDNNDENKNQKIIISFAILHAINNADNKGNNNYNLIFEEVIKSGAFGKDNKCDLETLKFVFDQMLCRGDGQDDTNRLSIPFNENGQKLFDRALGCLDDNSVKHSEIFDFLQDYFIPNGPGVVQQKPGLISKIFSRLKNLLKKIKGGGVLQNNNDNYLKPENFKPKKRKGQDSKENPSQDNNGTEKKFDLSEVNVINIMQESNNRFLFYSNGREEDEDKQRTDATNKFLTPYKNETKYSKGLASETIVKYISKFRFQNLESFEDFMKKYWTYDKLFCDTDLTIICANENFEFVVDQGSIEFYVARLKLMNMIKTGNYDTEENKSLLAYLAQRLKKTKTVNENVSADGMKNYYRKFCDLKKDDENQEKINREIELLFGPKKEYKYWRWGLSIDFLVTVILLIILVNSSTVDAYLLIAVVISIVIAGICIKNLINRKKFNDEQEELENLGKGFDPKEKGLYTLGLDLPPQDLVENQCNNYQLNANNNPPNMRQANAIIIDTGSNLIPFQN